MNWLRGNIEHAVLLAVLLVAAVVGLLAALGLDMAVPPPEGSARAAKQVDSDLEAYAGLDAELGKAPNWRPPESGHRLFISRRIEWLPAEGKLAVYDETKGRGRYGITDEWLKKHRFPTDVLRVEAQDEDGDGFVNGEEFQKGTDPRDPASHAPYTDKLRVASYEPVPFKMMLGSYEMVSGENVFQIRMPGLPDRRKQRQLVKIGGVVEGWKAVAFRQKVYEKLNDKTGIMQTYDESELDLANEISGDQITLVKGVLSDAPRHTGKLLFLVENRQIDVFKGGTFEMKGATYKVLDLKDGAASVAPADQPDAAPVAIGPVKGDDQTPSGGAPGAAAPPPP